MLPFTILEAADNLKAITTLADNPNAKVIGGGTNLLDLMKMYVESPKQLVDINHLNLNKIEHLSAGGVRIGALVRNSDLAYDHVIKTSFPVLSEALLSGASAQLRNMATVGGNLLQRTRCPYFFNVTFPCNKRIPGSGCSALNGYNRSHAILGGSDKCIATHPSDMCVALMALGASINVEGSKGSRSIPINDFYLLPGDTPEKETVLQHDELIVSVSIPSIPGTAKSHYLKVRDRASYEFALTSAAVILDVSGGAIKSAQIALGGVGTKPWRAVAAEQLLIGASNTVANYRLAADAVMKEARVYKHNGFKVELGKRTLIRALEITGGLS